MLESVGSTTGCHSIICGDAKNRGGVVVGVAVVLGVQMKSYRRVAAKVAGRGAHGADVRRLGHRWYFGAVCGGPRRTTGVAGG